MLILFVCVENAGRSQIAEAYAKRLGRDAVSAGTMPAEKVNPLVIKVMKEDGIDISAAHPKLLTKEMILAASLVVTMGCSVQDVCPAPLIKDMQKKIIEWHIEDPNGKSIEKIREIRDTIKTKVSDILNKQ
ncbi:MAG: low molecular weight phosphotyrosine protein phosphatase [Candidatus Parvarchaeum acidophilus ARMAN-5]|jgi:protein-tyrosine-phosphatase|uniref:Low molecular weight phosphotyrosine protein phosphatase n=1 Tax=Candidatus Parvarchaeum acidophilus ARMAN-5 TaxID=662762 RepID=D6GVM4_PARA5|nr:MAG: low molecular weight phosphotyrosine protein phosphatase [Candidatus Parvarchaeum acidophilus ARMAN-5]